MDGHVVSSVLISLKSLLINILHQTAPSIPSVLPSYFLDSANCIDPYGMHNDIKKASWL